MDGDDAGNAMVLFAALAIFALAALATAYQVIRQLQERGASRPRQPTRKTFYSFGFLYTKANFVVKLTRPPCLFCFSHSRQLFCSYAFLVSPSKRRKTSHVKCIIVSLLSMAVLSDEGGTTTKLSTHALSWACICHMSCGRIEEDRDKRWRTSIFDVDTTVRTYYMHTRTYARYDTSQQDMVLLLSNPRCV